MFWTCLPLDSNGCSKKMKSFDYCKKDIVRSLKKIGVKKKDTIFCHSDILKFGIPSCGLQKKKIAQLFYESFFEVIGKEGTFILPTFSYSFCKKEVYKPNISNSICGFLTEELRKNKKNFLLYPDPNLSCIVFGRYKKYLTKFENKNSYGHNSLFHKFYLLNGKICNLNLDAGSTFLHFLERKLKIKYRFEKKFFGKIKCKSDIIKDYSIIYVVYKKIKKKVSFDKFTKFAKKKGYFKQSNLGRGNIGLINSKDCLKILKKNLKKNQNFLFE